MSLLTDLFDAQLAVLESDLAKDLIPAIQKSVNSMAANPTALNIVAQAEMIVITGATELPGLAQDELKSLATWVNLQLQKLASKAPPAPATPAPTSK